MLAFSHDLPLTSLFEFKSIQGLHGVITGNHLVVEAILCHNGGFLFDRCYLRLLLRFYLVVIIATVFVQGVLEFHVWLGALMLFLDRAHHILNSVSVTR